MDGAVTLIAVISILLNLPLGYLRAGYRRYSLAWFAGIHASIPILVALRLWLGVRWVWVPAFIVSAILGQIIGGWRARLRSDRRRSANAP